MRALIAAVVVCLGCDGGRKDSAPAPSTKAATSGAAKPADLPAAVTAPAAPAPIGAGPCIGTWRLELAGWNKPKQTCGADQKVDQTLLVVRGAGGKGYDARLPVGIQDLLTEVKADTDTSCTIVVSDMFSHRSYSNQIVYTLGVNGDKVTAAGRYSEEDFGGETETGCERTFKLTATKTSLAAPDLAFDVGQAAKEFDALWAGEASLTLKEWCEAMPVMKTKLPRTAKIELSIDNRGGLQKLVIDGVEQGKLEDVCSFPMALEEADPVGFTNRSGVAQTVTFNAQLN